MQPPQAATHAAAAGGYLEPKSEIRRRLGAHRTALNIPARLQFKDGVLKWRLTATAGVG